MDGNGERETVDAEVRLGLSQLSSAFVDHQSKAEIIRNIAPWRLPHDADHSCSGFRKDELCMRECSSTEELDGETYKRKSCVSFETIYVPALPIVQKEKVGGEIAPTEPFE